MYIIYIYMSAKCTISICMLHLIWLHLQIKELRWRWNPQFTTLYNTLTLEPSTVSNRTWHTETRRGTSRRITSDGDIVWGSFGPFGFKRHMPALPPLILSNFKSNDIFPNQTAITTNVPIYSLHVSVLISTGIFTTWSSSIHHHHPHHNHHHHHHQRPGSLIGLPDG